MNLNLNKTLFVYIVILSLSLSSTLINALRIEEKGKKMFFAYSGPSQGLKIREGT